MRRVWPLVDFFRCEEATVLMTHIGGYPRRYDPRILPRIRSARPTLFVAGHSHILRIIYDPVYGAEVRDMEIGEWPRSTGAHP